jgi:regulator of RNase E activity RraA
MAMLRHRILTGSAEFRLVYTVRSPDDYVFADAFGAAVIPAGDVSAVLHAAYQVVAADAESMSQSEVKAQTHWETVRTD